MKGGPDPIVVLLALAVVVAVIGALMGSCAMGANP